MDVSNLDEAGRKALGLRIQQACNRQRLTQKQLADRAGYDEKTVRNVIRGEKTRMGTLEDICAVLKIEVAEAPPEKESVSAALNEYGGYGRDHVEDYFGLFVAYRRSFTFPVNLVRSAYEFAWSDAKTCLTFREVQKYKSSELDAVVDFSQEGDVYISHSVGLLHLLTKFRGALRLITLSKLRLDDNTMRGTVLTQAQGEFYYQPSTSPILLQKAHPDLTAGDIAETIGPVRPGDAEYERIERALTDVERKVSIFALSATARTKGANGQAAA